MSEEPGDPILALARGGPYAPDAYRYIYSALDYTLRTVGRESGHVSGRELLDGIRRKAREEWGGMARMVFARWGITTTDDIGEIVFRLVEAGLMGKTERDSREDFKGVYDFADAFPMFEPLKRNRKK